VWELRAYSTGSPLMSDTSAAHHAGGCSVTSGALAL